MEPPKTAIYTGTFKNSSASITMDASINISLIACCLLCLRLNTFCQTVEIADYHINIGNHGDSVDSCIRYFQHAGGTAAS